MRIQMYQKPQTNDYWDDIPHEKPNAIWMPPVNSVIQGLPRRLLAYSNVSKAPNKRLLG